MLCITGLNYDRSSIKASIQFHSNVTYKVDTFLNRYTTYAPQLRTSIVVVFETTIVIRPWKQTRLFTMPSSKFGCAAVHPSRQISVTSLDWRTFNLPVVFLLRLENDTILLWDCCHILSFLFGSPRFYPMHWGWCSSHIQDQLQKKSIRFSHVVSWWLF